MAGFGQPREKTVLRSAACAAFGVLVNQRLWRHFVVVKGSQFIGRKPAFRQALGRAGQRAIYRPHRL